MKVNVFQTAEEAAQVLVTEISQLCADNTTLNLGFATGKSMLPVYSAMRSTLGAELPGICGWNLDEYWPQSAAGDLSFASFMRAQFPLANTPAQLPGTDLTGAELDQFCKSYEDRLEASGGIDLQLLGIGVNGHIGFNEPGSAPDSRTRLVKLTTSTIERAGFPEGSSPQQAISMGIENILAAKRIRICVFGQEKSAAVARAIESNMDSSCPASFLQIHADISWFLDREAAAGLSSS